ncbi:MAG: hypothetical protein ABEN55_18710, partial [Bradymonadaceae bacterium]
MHRGLFVSKTLLCNRPPDPPDTLPVGTYRVESR